MPAPKGNKYYLNAENFFKPKAYSPQQWGETFIKYLEESKEETWAKKEVIKGGARSGDIVNVGMSAPLSIESFCVFAGVTFQTFYNYESKEGYEEYFEITARIRQYIESKQLEGAILDIWNPSIIARKLGLKERTDVTSNDSEYQGEVRVTIVHPTNDEY